MSFNDPEGLYPRKAIIAVSLDPEGKSPWVTPPPVHTRNKHAQEMEQLIYDFIVADSMDDLWVIKEKIFSYESITNAFGLSKVALGAKKMVKGFGLIIFPTPSSAEDALGAMWVLWGFHGIVYGIGELLGWVEE